MWKERGKKGKGGNGFFHFKSHFVQSQMTVFKDALSLSLFSGFWTAAPILMVRYHSPSLSSLFLRTAFPPSPANHTLWFSGATLSENIYCFFQTLNSKTFLSFSANFDQTSAPLCVTRCRLFHKAVLQNGHKHQKGLWSLIDPRALLCLCAA